MKNYPYGCMEQRISIAVALRDAALWKRWMSELPSYLDSEGLVKYFPTGLYGSPTLTSYILAIGHEAGWSVPDETRERMEAALRRFVEGSLLRSSPMPTADLTLRKLSAIEALSRLKKADAKLLGSISIEPNLWPTSALIDWLNILQHVQAIPNRDERHREAEQILRSRLNFQGTTMGFSTEKTDALWWLMFRTTSMQCGRCYLCLVLQRGRRICRGWPRGPDPAGQGKMGPDAGQCVGRSGHGEVFPGL